ncbi:MAG: hypothetical protein LBE20_06080 [Deltaproteobacteria bacterium]|jgi:HEAT repeat protein|nr:hypothetical protein [Deltaproteobacteria bacterium]
MKSLIFKKLIFTILPLILLLACEQQKTLVDYNVEMLIKKLDSAKETEQLISAYQLAHYGQYADLAVPKLSNILQNGSWPTKINTINTLKKIGTPNAVNVLEENLPELIANLSTSDFQTQLFSIQAIGYYGQYGIKSLPELSKTIEIADKNFNEFRKKNRLDLARQQKILADAARYTIEQIYIGDKIPKKQ